MVKKKVVGEQSYPLQVYVVVEGGMSGEPMSFIDRQEALSFAKEMMDDEGMESITIGTYTLSGLKKLTTKIVEEDI